LKLKENDCEMKGLGQILTQGSRRVWGIMGGIAMRGDYCCVLNDASRQRATRFASVGVVILLIGAVVMTTPRRAGATVPTCFGSTATIVGTPGDDTLVGTNGNDVIWAGAGDDVVFGRGGNDKICGGDGNDIIDGGNGNDKISGGGGRFDIVSFLSATGPINADLAKGTATGQGADTFTSVEGLAGGPYSDSLYGNGGMNFLVGGKGNDLLDGRGGVDLVGYLTIGTQGVTVNLATGKASGQGSDTLRGIEGVLGTDNADTLIGSNNADILAGLKGNDTIRGGNGNDTLFGEEGNDHLYGGGGFDELSPGPGNDTIDGGAQGDTADFSDSATSVNANLATGSATGEGSDTLTSVESLVGTDHSDTLIGNNLNNHLDGLAGDDVLQGAGGNDVLQGGPGTDTLDGGAGTDQCLSGETVTNCEIDTGGAAALPTSGPSGALRVGTAAVTDQLDVLSGQHQRRSSAQSPITPFSPTGFDPGTPGFGDVVCPWVGDPSHVWIGPHGEPTGTYPNDGYRLWYEVNVFARTPAGWVNWVGQPIWFYRDASSYSNDFYYDQISSFAWFDYTYGSWQDDRAIDVSKAGQAGYPIAVAEQWFLTRLSDNTVVDKSSYRWDNSARNGDGWADSAAMLCNTNVQGFG
jgi:Ca2+-binding RTX toxin-like protein